MSKPETYVIRLALSCIGGLGSPGCDSGDTEDSVVAFEQELRIDPRSAHRHGALTPLVSCVERNKSGELIGHFGYRNRSGSRIRIPVGPNNGFRPFPSDRSQPTLFRPGEHNDVVQVNFGKMHWPPVWTLGDSVAMVTLHSPRCVSNTAGGSAGTAGASAQGGTTAGGPAETSSGDAGEFASGGLATGGASPTGGASANTGTSDAGGVASGGGAASSGGTAPYDTATGGASSIGGANESGGAVTAAGATQGGASGTLGAVDCLTRRTVLDLAVTLKQCSTHCFMGGAISAVSCSSIGPTSVPLSIDRTRASLGWPTTALKNYPGAVPLQQTESGFVGSASASNALYPYCLGGNASLQVNADCDLGVVTVTGRCSWDHPNGCANDYFEDLSGSVTLPRLPAAIPTAIPTFAGVSSATTISDTSIALSWIVATDDATPASNIEYDICVDTTLGGCVSNFVSVQTATTRRTTVNGLSANTPYYVVVRARNVLGEEQNVVELSTRTCDTAQVACDGACVSLSSDPANCGKCGNRCGATACSSGECFRAGPPVTAVAAGNHHTCALLANGTVRCWGSGRYGELGNGTTGSSLRPIIVSNLSGVTSIAANLDDVWGRTCALTMDGRAMCWGSWASNTVPVEVDGVSDAIAIGLGWAHSCFLVPGGVVQCFGSDTMGQLGAGTNAIGATAIAVGEWFSCAVVANGSVTCWGDNGNGQLGDGTQISRASPSPVLGLTGVKAVAAGNFHTCALSESGSMSCWGNNADGQLGDGTTTSQIRPVAVHVDAVVTAIASGAYHNCALLADRTVVCWGANSAGQVGNGSVSAISPPSRVLGLNNVVALGLGTIHSCAVVQDGSVWCWGRNFYGQLGDGTTTDSPLPVAVKW